MANVKITDLTNYTAPETTDVMPIVDVTTDTTKKVSVGEVVGKITGDVDVATDGTSSITAGAIVDADVNANAEIAVSKLADGTARQLLQTDAAGTGVEWTDNVDVPGTLDVTGATTLDSTLQVAGNTTIEGDLTVEGTTTTIETTTLLVEDKNIEMGVVDTPSDTTADGGGITLKGATDKTINWVNATDAWTSSEHIELASGKEFYIDGNGVLNATTLGSGVVNSSLTSVGTIATGTWEGTAIDDTYLDTISTAGKVSNSATTATDANTASAIVARDASGDFTAGTITADLTGNADTATALSSSRTFAVTGDVTGTVNSDLTSGASIATSIASGVIVDGDVNASAAIAGTKIDPDFGSQTVETTGVFSAAGGAETTPSITFTGDLNTGLWSPSADTIAASTAGNEAVRIDSSATLLVGTSTSVGSAITQIRNDSSGFALSLQRSIDGNNPVRLLAERSRGSVGTPAALQDDDQIWEARFYGHDGSAYQESSLIAAEVDGTVSDVNDSVPGRLVFSVTADGSASPTEAMRINNAGELLVGYTSDNGAYKLQVNSQIFATSATIATSDGRYKENVAPLNGSLDLVKALRPVSFTWKPQEDITRLDEEGNEVLVREGHNFPEGTQVGFIAQEVQEVLDGKPWLGSVIKENVRPAVKDNDGNELAPEEQFYGIAEGNLIAVLTNALQEAVGRIEALEAEVAALKS